MSNLWDSGHHTQDCEHAPAARIPSATLSMHSGQKDSGTRRAREHQKHPSPPAAWTRTVRSEYYANVVAGRGCRRGPWSALWTSGRTLWRTDGRARLRCSGTTPPPGHSGATAQKRQCRAAPWNDESCSTDKSRGEVSVSLCQWCGDCAQELHEVRLADLLQAMVMRSSKNRPVSRPITYPSLCTAATPATGSRIADRPRRASCESQTEAAPSAGSSHATMSPRQKRWQSESILWAPCLFRFSSPLWAKRLWRAATSLAVRPLSRSIRARPALRVRPCPRDRGRAHRDSTGPVLPEGGRRARFWRGLLLWRTVPLPFFSPSATDRSQSATARYRPKLP
ncbi:hypothetical protein EK21DRAFT_88258 [Setomelanomma holmii]|uniref:Uncharacterized protein n=1 Tax=Setomelanomma holmii TaxID=210430 RepID=A0A9P4HBS4_9PLEO|nr:hypothetical protein EK21DRAFT_88258 [Setomelanomma holmii]